MAILCLVFILLHEFRTDAVLQFTRPYQGQIIKKTLGSSVNFTWTFTGNVETIDWGIKDSGADRFEPNGRILSLTKANVQTYINPGYSGRATGSLSGNSVSRQVVFTLNAINRNDMKSYLCTLQPGFGDTAQHDNVQLIVEGPPVITDISPNATVNEGEAVTLTCTANGYPPANTTWTKDNKVVNFPLNKIRRENAGLYRCRADNGVGNPDTADVFITVQYAASIERVTPFTSQSWIGQNITLTCEANGVPKPNIVWIKPGGAEINKVGVTEDTANVLMKTDQDFGIYTCNASNGVGAAATKTVKVQQIKAPGSPIVTVNIQATSITVTWTKPSDNGGSRITAYRVLILQGNNAIRNENITDLLTMKKYFGGLNKSTNYTVRVFARNYVFEGIASERKIRTNFEGAPSAAEIIDLPAETNETEITLKWKEAENNGAPITKYTVYQRIVLDDGTSLKWVKIREIKDSQTTATVVKLEKGKDYEFVVTATNKFGEGVKEEGKIKRIKVLGGVPAPVNFSSKVKDGNIIFEWEEPNNNGAAITLYTVYYGSESENITYVSKRTYVVKVVKGKQYKVVVTASNKYGESSKEGKIQQINVPKGSEPNTQAKTTGLNTAVVAGAAAGGVLVIVGVIVFSIWWKRRKSSSNDTSSSQAAWRNGNPYDEDDGYQDVRASAAAQGLQESGRPVAEPSYAQVDMSKKKRNKRPVIDEYAVVDKSKKFKKARKRPGELDYAELDDLRPNIQPAAAEAAPARPLVRRPAYEETEYADITQFGVPQPEPTYGNMPKKDVVYSNVQGI